MRRASVKAWVISTSMAKTMSTEIALRSTHGPRGAGLHEGRRLGRLAAPTRCLRVAACLPVRSSPRRLGVAGPVVEAFGLILHHDLQRAGIAYVDEDGRYRDFHSLR